MRYTAMNMYFGMRMCSMRMFSHAQITLPAAA